MALDADRKNGPAARSFAADAHDCIMVRIKRPYRIQVCGTKMRRQWRAPLGFSKIDRHRQTLKPDYDESPVAISTSFAMVFMLRAVPAFPAGMRRRESAIPLP